MVSLFRITDRRSIYYFLTLHSVLEMYKTCSFQFNRIYQIIGGSSVPPYFYEWLYTPAY
uniref:Uncharacterized protein n=1 Tax=Heterorhabditis bacteriophora TaxID=37862 RepID=A0A1I7XQS2_HETBA